MRRIPPRTQVSRCGFALDPAFWAWIPPGSQSDPDFHRAGSHRQTNAIATASRSQTTTTAQDGDALNRFIRSKLEVQWTVRLFFCKQVIRFHCGNRPPSDLKSASIRELSARQRPSTFKFILMSSQHCFSRASYSARVSSHGRDGTLRASRRRSHDTAVSWSMSSCSLPGCAEASSPNIALNRHRRSASL